MVGHDLNVSISGFNIVSREKDTNFEILDAAENTISLIDIKSGWGISIWYDILDGVLVFDMIFCHWLLHTNVYVLNYANESY